MYMNSTERGGLIYLVVWVVVTLILWPIIYSCTDLYKDEKSGDKGRVSTTFMAAQSWPATLALALIVLPFWLIYKAFKRDSNKSGWH